MDTVTIEAPDVQEIRAGYSPLIERAEGLVVEDQPSHQAALEYLRDLKAAEKNVRARLDPIIQTAHQAHKQLTSLRGEVLAPIETARRTVSGKATDYEAEQERLARQKQREAEARARREEEERRLAEAAAAEEAGDAEQAEAILNEDPAPVAVAPVQAETAQVRGVSSRTTYKAEVRDLGALIRHVAEHPELQGLLQPNWPRLNSMARAQREALRLPGVRVVAQRSAVVR